MGQESPTLDGGEVLPDDIDLMDSQSASYKETVEERFFWPRHQRDERQGRESRSAA